METDMDQKFREAFILFSSSNEKLELYQFYELMNSFGIILQAEEKAELPDFIDMDFWLNFARKHFNYDEPFKHIVNINEKGHNLEIKTDNFFGVMKALDTRLTENDFDILMEITNPEKKETIDLKTVSQRLTQFI